MAEIEDDLLREEWYYCLDHKTVEPEYGCRADVRLGPFPTEEEAAAALEKVDQRNQDWETDPAWNDQSE